MTGYTIHLTTRNPAGGDPQGGLAGVDAFVDQLIPHSGAVAGGAAGYAATISIDAPTHLEAAITGTGVVQAAARNAGLPAWPVVRLEVLTNDEADRDLAIPTLPDMVSGQIAADILGVTRQRLHQLRDNPRFPDPLLEQPGAILWARAAIDRFAEIWERKPGRPPRADTPRTAASHTRDAAGVILEGTDREATDMADKKPIHTVPHNDGWANKKEGAGRVSNTAATKAEAQAKGREMAKDAKVEHVIHNKDGKIGEKNSYGNDPRSSKG